MLFFLQKPPTNTQNVSYVFHMEKNRTKRRQAITKMIVINT